MPFRPHVHPGGPRQPGNRRWINLNGPQFQQLRQGSIGREHCRAERVELTTTKEISPKVQAIYFTSNAFNLFWRTHAAGARAAAIGCTRGPGPGNVSRPGLSVLAETLHGDPGIVGRENPAGSQELHDRGRSPAAIYLGDADVYLPLKLTADPVRTFYP